MATIYHIAKREEWNEAQNLNQYEASSLATEGFIHCSESHQVIRVANSFFKETSGLILLHIDVETLSAPLIYENLEGGDENFPHVYGPINLNAVTCVLPFEPDMNGSFDNHIHTSF